ncbi:MAG TPA: cyclic nucleotide-binding domain-containing protein [Usitatibacter sp.]|jgi:CRP-like cAMP-binding protein|nr:cyclic nucleotide-binding domain-containing protein [Usitatibacter sp.]
MDDFDFTKPQATQATEAPGASAPFKAASSPFYDARVAEALFRASGREERFAAGAAVFAEDDPAKAGLFSRKSASRMYFVVSGEVALTIGGKPLDVMKAGDVFGEMAVISERPRSASATARTDVVAHSLSAAELQQALAGAPQFALMIMSVMSDRLRFIAARLAARRTPLPASARELSVFDKNLLADFEAALPRAAIVRHWSGANIMREGQTGAFMYVVKSGRVAISIREHVVEYVNPGGTFGEMALVDQSARTASATAELDCVLLSVDRPSLLQVVGARPAFAMALLRALVERLRFMNSVLSGAAAS